MDVSLICVGKLRESFYKDACAEYIKRLGAYCKISVTEMPEERKGDSPSEGEKRACLEREADLIMRAVPRGAALTALCIEGRQMSSEELARTMEGLMASSSKLCFVIGGSDGLSERVKAASRLRLSMSPMTFPHHLARVMVLEQLYRGFSIINNGKYHK